jgi:putative ABC transport system permease protein
MALNKRIRRVLWENKAQYLGSVALIIFSTLMFNMTTHFARNFERLANEFQSGYLQEDAAFATDKKIENIAALETDANVTIEEGFTLDYLLTEGQTLRIFSQNEKLNLLVVLEGKALCESGCILVNPAFAQINHYAIGDRLEILERTFTISGFMALPNNMYPLQSETDMMAPPGFGIAVISKADFAALGKGRNFYALKFHPTWDNPRTRSAAFRDLLASRGIEAVQWTNIEDNRQVNIVTAEVEILNLVSRGVPGAVLLLVIILTGNVMRRLIQRESAVIGALYALGCTRGEITRHYLMIPLLIAAAGGMIGTILGIFPIRTAVAFFTSVFNMPLTGIQLNPVIMIVSVLLPVVILTASSYLVIRKELKHSPVELMRGKASNNQVNFLERALRLDALSFAARFKIREQLRSLSRLAFLLFGVAAATMLLLWGFVLKSGFDYMLTSGLTSAFDFMYEYKFDTPRSDALPAGAEPASSALFLPEVAPGQEDKRDFYVSGISPESEMVTLQNASGAPIRTNQVIITRPLANLLKVQQGGRVNIVRKLDGRTFAVKIDSIAETYAGNFIFMPLADYNQLFELPQGSYNGAFSNVLLDIPASQSYSLVTLEDKVAGVREVIAPTQSMIGFLSTLAFIIGLIVIYLVTSMIVEENKIVISLLKIFGYRKKEINGLILNSSTIVVVIGYLLGIPLILAAIGGLLRSMETSIGMTLPPGRIDLVYLLLGFVVVMIAYELSKLLCRKKVNAIPMSEALKAGME